MRKFVISGIWGLLITGGTQLACTKAQFRGGEDSPSKGSTADASRNGNSPTGKPGTGYDTADTGRYNPDSLKDPNNPDSPLNPNSPFYNPANPASPVTDGKFEPGDNRDPDHPKSPFNPNFGGSGPISACTVGDKVNFGWTGAEKDCIDQGKTYNFDSNVCQEMRRASFNCDWQTLLAEIAKVDPGLVTDALRKGATDGSKLVSCGQSTDGMRVVVQWVKVDDLGQLSCQNTGNNNPFIITGCYTKHPGTPPPPPKDEQERRDRVFECLKTI